MIENIGAYSKVDYDRGYQQGREDAIDELFCVITYEDYQQIVDKIIKQYSQPRRKGKYNLNYLIFNEFMALICKKLKEQTNEQ